MKRKIIWGTVIAVVLGFIIWMDLPYIIKTSNIISNQYMEYTYQQIVISDYSLMDWDNIDSGDYMKFIYDESEMQFIIEKVDRLKLRRTKEIGNGEKHISFTASYSPEERVTYTEGVLSIYFQVTDKGDNILYIYSKRQGDKYYKILDKDFDVEAFFKDIWGEAI